MPNYVEIRAPNTSGIRIGFSPELKAAAVEWSHIVRNRMRWAGQADSRTDLEQDARDVLAKLGLAGPQMDALRSARVVQISIPFVREELGWEARIFPWEYVLSSALNQGGQPLIVRHLQRSGGSPSGSAEAAPTPFLIVESAPGAIRNEFVFESERWLVQANMQPHPVDVFTDPTPTELRDYLANHQPRAIHLAGLDAHQGAAALGMPDPEIDGYYMLDDNREARAVRAEELAALLVAGSTELRLVSCNFQNSAARVAAMLVAVGAHAAIGFQDEVDDSFAELFFATFYERWHESGWRTFPAFRETFMAVQSRRESLRGTGIVLWSAADLLQGNEIEVAPASLSIGSKVAASPREAAADGHADEANPSPSVDPVAPASTASSSMAPGTVPAEIWVEATVVRRVNYALLQNNQALFDSFRIRKRTTAPVEGVEVEVVLYAGGRPFPYKRTLTLTDPITELRDVIRVPLTAALLRRTHETIQSVVYAIVRRGGEVVYQDTFPVSLVSVEEWTYNDDDAIWLPSFVFPRDPAIDEIVQSARAVLRVLRDEGFADFDGYQSRDPQRDDQYEFVEMQVNALWSTLAFSYDLSYINPPPTYSPHSQRLRSPSAVLQSKAGTCIDLAVLFAACLELVEVYPVIVLFDGHAVPGYWRGDDLHTAFTLGRTDPPAGPAAHPPGPVAADSAGTHQVQVAPWQLRRQSSTPDPILAELVLRTKSRDLVLLEGTMLTKRTGYGEASDLGMKRLTAGGFRSMVDVQLARRYGVTPLPLRD